MNGYLTLDELATRWGVKPSTLRVRKHRGDLPEPDLVVSRIPMWRPETIEAYEREADARTER